MKVARVSPYSGPADADGTVEVFDVTVVPAHTYRLAAGVVVGNSKRVSLLDVNALLSHGAVATLRDAGAVRGQKNEDFWLQFMSGHTPRAPRVPFVYNKFVESLRGAGINVVRDGHRTHVMALTDKDVDALAGGREVKSGETVRFDKGLQPLPGGLFDPTVTGGHGGTRWAAVPLHEPMLNPVMEEPARRILGLTAKQFEATISGDHEIPGHGTGPAAVASALKKVDLDREIAVARAAIDSGKKTKRDEAVRKLGYLVSAKKLGVHPGDWVLKRAPVLPPAFRPVTTLGDSGTPLVSDPNYLYRELIEANNNLREMKGVVGDQGAGPERLALYHAFKAVTGLGDPITAKSQEKKVKGLLAGIFGSSPKFGTVQRKLLSSTVDNVGRGVIVPNPDLDMDSIGLPADKAFEVYGKFVARRLHRTGMPLSEAMRAVKDRAPIAREALVAEMDKRPVYANRAPVLHRFGVMAFRPQLMAGDVMHMSPLVVKGFGADFDGDTMQFHVPTSDDSVAEAYDRMMPSRNLLSPADFKSPMHAPTQEYLGGLYHATSDHSDRPVRHFRSVADARAAYERGEIGVRDRVEIVGAG